MYTAADLENTVKSLESSPLFQVSHSDKELFHSDFLYWLWISQRKFAEAVLQELLGVDDKFFENSTAFREKKHFDFSIWKKKGRKNVPILILENKMKSIANEQQLDAYFKKVDNEYNSADCKFVLLTLAPPNVNRKSWIIKTYENYYEALDRHKGLIDDADKHKIYIEDYISFVKNVVSLSKSWKEESLQDLIKSDMNEEMRRLRLHDIRQKIIYSKFKEDLCRALAKNNYYVIRDAGMVDFWKDKDKFKPSDDRPIICVYSGYMQAGGMVSINFITSSDLVLSKNAIANWEDCKKSNIPVDELRYWNIQIQSDQYRIGCEKQDKHQFEFPERIKNSNRAGHVIPLYQEFIDEIKFLPPSIFPSLAEPTDENKEMFIDYKLGEKYKYGIGQFSKIFFYVFERISDILMNKNKDESVTDCIIRRICDDLQKFRKDLESN